VGFDDVQLLRRLRKLAAWLTRSPESSPPDEFVHSPVGCGNAHAGGASGVGQRDRAGVPANQPCAVGDQDCVLGESEGLHESLSDQGPPRVLFAVRGAPSPAKATTNHRISG
jgi:hypothetical protein